MRYEWEPADDHPDFPEARMKIEDARRRIMNRHEFFAGPLLCLDIVAAKNLPMESAATDGHVIAYDPTFIKNLSVDQVVGLLVHEILHNLLLHRWRFPRGLYDGMVANVACDFAINNWIEEYSKASREPITLPPDGCVDLGTYGHAAEELIYNELFKKLKPPTRGRPGKKGPGKGEGEEEGEGKGKGDSDGKDKGEGEGKGKGESDKPDGKRDSYSPGEFLQADPNEEDADEDGKSMQDKWEEIFTTTIHEAKMRGTLPGSFIEKLQSRLNKEVNWEVVLRNHMVSTADTDFSEQYPDRRILSTYDVVVPSLMTDAPGHLVFVVDTSGSMSSDILQRAFGSVRQGMKALRIPKLTFMQVDTRVCEVLTLKHTDPLPDVKGRGGTDFCPAFEYVDQHLRDVRCLIYLTDGFGCFPERKPRYPVIWVDYYGEVEYPWGKVINLNRKK